MVIVAVFENVLDLFGDFGDFLFKYHLLSLLCVPPYEPTAVPQHTGQDTEEPAPEGGGSTLALVAPPLRLSRTFRKAGRAPSVVGAP